MNDQNKELFLTLASVFSYLKANVESRCIVEGEELLNAKHVILIGVTAESEALMDILALCLQTSAIKSSPHEINGKLNIVDGDKIEISQFQCSCKAGLSGTCKHIAAALLKCTRSNIFSLEKLSSTDIKCYWSNKKRKVEDEYEAKPILETACFKAKVAEKRGLSSEEQKDCFNLLTSVCPESSLSLHLKGRFTAPSTSGKKKIIPPLIKTIISHASMSEFLNNLSLKMELFHLKACCKHVANDIVNLKDFDKVITSQQRSDIWYQERQLRITGSRCYSLYTYNKGDWQSKTKNYFWQKKFSTKYIEHGVKYENEAMERYKTSNNYNVCQMGLVICKQYPWIAYSPDGVVMSDGCPTRLVEIKCPYDGLENDAINFVHTCSFLEVNAESGLSLKKKHAYYGQVQLGMAVLNLQICDFIVYSAKSKSFLNIIVPFDEDFAKDMIVNITEKYFNHMIHYICEKREVE